MNPRAVASAYVKTGFLGDLAVVLAVWNSLQFGAVYTTTSSSSSIAGGGVKMWGLT